MMNKEGLTWEEWAQAAAVPPEFALAPTVVQLYQWRSAWCDGEDPSEWRKARLELEQQAYAGLAVPKEHLHSPSSASASVGAGIEPRPFPYKKDEP